MNEQLQAAEARLSAALLAGEDPVPHRNAIAQIKRTMATREEAAAQEVEKVAISRKARVAERTTTIVQGVVDRLSDAVRTLPNIPPTSVGDVEQKIAYLAQDIADAEDRLADAQEAYLQERNRVTAAEQRIADVKKNRENIRTQLNEGSLSLKEAGSLLAVADEDLVDLKQILDDALVKEERAKPLQLDDNLSQAKASLTRIEKQLVVDALRHRISMAEVVIVDALKQSIALLQAAGHPVSVQSVRSPSNDMVRAVQHRAFPSAGGFHG